MAYGINLAGYWPPCFKHEFGRFAWFGKRSAITLLKKGYKKSFSAQKKLRKLEKWARKFSRKKNHPATNKLPTLTNPQQQLYIPQ